MKQWLYLTGAIIAEVTGTMSLRGAVDNTAWVAVAVVAYLGAVVLLGMALRAGFAVGLAYGIWSAVGVVITAILAGLLFSETLSIPAAVGIGLIVIGVLVVETGSKHSPTTQPIPIMQGDL